MAVANAYASTARQVAWARLQTIWQLRAANTKAVEIMRLRLAQETTVQGAPLGVQLYTATSAITWTAGGTIKNSRLNPSDLNQSSSISAFGTGTVTEGAGQVVLLEEAWDLVDGWLYLPPPEARIVVAAATYLCLKLLGTAVPSATYVVCCTFREMG